MGRLSKVDIAIIQEAIEDCDNFPQARFKLLSSIAEKRRRFQMKWSFKEFIVCLVKIVVYLLAYAPYFAYAVIMSLYILFRSRKGYAEWIPWPWHWDWSSWREMRQWEKEEASNGMANN